MRTPKAKRSTYELSRVARAGRWWRARRDSIGLALLACAAIGALLAIVLGQPAVAGAIGIIGLLYAIYAFTNWFNGLH